MSTTILDQFLRTPTGRTTTSRLVVVESGFVVAHAVTHNEPNNLLTRSRSPACFVTAHGPAPDGPNLQAWGVVMARRARVAKVVTPAERYLRYRPISSGRLKMFR